MTVRTDTAAGVRLATQVAVWPLTVWIAMLGWSLALFAMVWSRYEDFRLARFDLGNMVQAVWSTTHGRPLEATDTAGEQVVRLASHVDPILVLLAPVWVIFPSPLSLAAVQIAACALGALPVFWLGRRHLGSEQAGVALALTYLGYPWLVWTALDAMHPVTLAIPLLVYAIWFLDSGRLWAFALCGVLVLATGELMGLSIAGLGFWYWLARGERRAGIAIAAAGFAWTIISLEIVIPHFRGEESPFYTHYEAVGGSLEGILRTAATEPGTILSAVTSADDFLYLFSLAAPLAGAFFLAPGLAAAALPQLAVNMLSGRSYFVDPRAHYVAAIIPFLVAATVFALRRIPHPRRVRVAALLLALSAACSLLLGPWPGTLVKPRPSAQPRSATRIAALRDAVSLVPKGAAVSATNAAGSRLSARRYFYSVPVVASADWIVADLRDSRIPVRSSGFGIQSPERLERFVTQIEASPDWLKVFDRDRVVVFRRTGR